MLTKERRREKVRPLIYYLTNGEVAWQMPDRIGAWFWEGFYRPPAGWMVVDYDHVGVCGELRWFYD